MALALTGGGTKLWPSPCPLYLTQLLRESPESITRKGTRGGYDPQRNFSIVTRSVFV